MIERRAHPLLHRMLLVDCGGIPWAVQSIEVHVNEFGDAARIMWRDCLGRTYARPLDWVLQRPFGWMLRTTDQLLVCRNYARYVLERDVARWWEPTS
jgi:hypothetical protein